MCRNISITNVQPTRKMSFFFLLNMKLNIVLNLFKIKIKFNADLKEVYVCPRKSTTENDWNKCMVHFSHWPKDLKTSRHYNLQSSPRKLQTNLNLIIFLYLFTHNMPLSFLIVKVCMGLDTNKLVDSLKYLWVFSEVEYRSAKIRRFEKTDLLFFPW